MKPSKKDQQEEKGPNWAHTQNSLEDNHALKRQAHSSNSAAWPATTRLGHTEHCKPKPAAV